MNIERRQDAVIWPVTSSVVVAVLLLAGTSIAINFAMTWNAAVNTRIVWFPVAILMLATGYWKLIRHYSPTLPGNSRRAWWVAIASASIVSLLGLTLMGWGNVLDGRVVMRGDKYAQSPLFALCVSLAMPLAAGVMEEISVRGYLQCRLAARVSAFWASLIAGTVFLAMHGSQLLEIKRLILLLTLAAVGGYLTSLSGRMGPAVFFHSTVNFAMAAMVLASRSRN
jgi:membrane protease YdiL (CAAX protease family)